MSNKSKRVLFVCLGNICRSPLAEGVFLSEIENLGLSSLFSADSAGTAGYHIGDDPDDRSTRIALNHGIRLSHKGRKFVREDFERFDFIIAMDENNKEDILALAGGNVEWKNKVFKMRDFDPIPEKGNVPDPYYGSLNGFEEVYQILKRSMDGFISILIEK